MEGARAVDAMELPTPLKSIGIYLKVADKIEKSDKIVAYHCRAYAAELGIEVMPKDVPEEDECNAYLSNLLDVLEKDKCHFSNMSQDDKKSYLFDFATGVSNNLVSKQLQGQINKDTARSFLFASVFYEILKQFGPLSPEALSHLTYLKQRAAEIFLDLKNGREPSLSTCKNQVETSPEESRDGNDSLALPPPTREQRPDSLDKMSNAVSFGTNAGICPTHNDSNDSYTQNTSVGGMSYQEYKINSAIDAATVKPHSELNSGTNSSKSSICDSFKCYNDNIALSDIEIITKATKVTRDAISALQFDDVETAIKALQEALRILTEERFCTL